MLPGLAVVQAVAIHPYGRRPTQNFPTPTWGFGTLESLVDQYRRFGKPIAITEFGVKLSDGFRARAAENAHPRDVAVLSRAMGFDGFRANPADVRGQYYGDMVTAAAEVGCEFVLPFKYEDEGVPGFGMRGTPALDAVTKASFNLDHEIEIQTPQNGEIAMVTEPYKGTLADWLAETEEKLWKPPNAPLIRSRGSGASKELTAWLDKPEWELVHQEGGYVWVERVYPNQ